MIHRLIFYITLSLYGCVNNEKKEKNFVNTIKTGTYEAISINDTLKLRLSVSKYAENKYYFSFNYFNSFDKMVRKGSFEDCYLSVVKGISKEGKLGLELISDSRVDSILLNINTGDSLRFNIFTSYQKRTLSMSENKPTSVEVKVYSKQTPMFLFKDSIPLNERQFDIGQGRLFFASFKEKKKQLRFYMLPDTLSMHYKFNIKNGESLHTVAGVRDIKTRKNGFTLVYFGLKNPKNSSYYLGYSDYKNHFWIHNDDLFRFFVE